MVLHDAYARPAQLDPMRLAFGAQAFTPTERFYARLIDGLGTFDRALDIGCGNGNKLRRLAHRGQISEGVGFDPSAAALTGADALAEVYPSSIPLRFEEVYLDGFTTDERFDLVLAVQVVNYLDPIDLFQLIRAVAADGATIVLSDADRPAALSERIKSSPAIRRATRKPALATGAHPRGIVLAAAEAAGLRLQAEHSSCRTVGSAVAGAAHRLSNRAHPPAGPKRRLASGAYRAIRAAWEVEDRVGLGEGAIYAYVLRA